MILSRRSALTAGAGVLTAGVVGLRARQTSRGGDSLLRIRPRRPTSSIGPGAHALGLGRERDGMLIVPRG